MQIITVAHPTRPSGASEAAVLLAQGLVLCAGLQILAIDLDPEAAFSRALGARARFATADMVLNGTATLRRAIQPSASGMPLLAASGRLRAPFSGGIQEAHSRLAAQLHDAAPYFDAAVLCAPAGCADLLAAALACSGWGLLAVAAGGECEASGFARSHAREGLQWLAIGGPSMPEPGKLEPLRLLGAQLVPCPALAAAMSVQQSVLDYAPQSPSAHSCQALSREIASLWGIA